MAAYVEIIFDNSDGRLSVESDEVVLRRTVGHKKDEFFVNRKRVQKAEVQSLLESAGFSKSNPYYFVQQGKVANLCVMKDTDRLTLLKDIAGTTVYEERRSESLAIMKETATKQERIQEVLSFIEERLAELEKEKEELSEYDVLDKQRRALEYTLYDKELSKAAEQLSAIENTRESERENHSDVHTQLQAIQDEIQIHEVALSTLKVGLDRTTEQKASKKAELQELLKRHTSIQVSLQEMEASSSAQGNERERMESELAMLQTQIVSVEKELSSVDPRFEELHTSQANAQATLDDIRSRIEQLYGKQGRGRQFITKEDRNKFLDEQVVTLENQITTKKEYVNSTTKMIEKESTRIQKEKNILQSAQSENNNRSKVYNSLTSDISEKTQQRNELQDDRKASWRALEAFQEQISEAKQDLDRGRQQLNSVLPRSLALGLKLVEEIVKEKKLEGYYGPLIDNFQLKNDVFRTAVEVAAGNALFHVIVDTNDTAAFLMKELEKRKGGRLTFLPLNRIHAPSVRYPDSTDVRPMVDVALDFEPDFEAPIRHVFGNKLLARDLDVASHFSKEYNLDAITRDGDLVNRRGGFEGGFHDERASKIGTVQKIRDATNKILELTKHEASLRQTAEETEASATDILRVLQNLESDREHIKSQIEQFSREIVGRQKALEQARNSLQSQRDGLTEVTREIVSLRQQIVFFQQEKDSDLSGLDDTEKEELLSLTNQERSVQLNLETTQQELATTNERREILKADLKNHLLKRKSELIAVLASANIGQSSSSEGVASADLSALRLEKQHLDSVVKAIEKEQEDIEKIEASKLNDINKEERVLEGHRQTEQKVFRGINEAAKMHDKLLNKRSMLMETVQIKQKQIRELGTLPRSELEDVRSKTEKQLLDNMAIVNERLKKFAGVNRKALDQYVSFNEQRDTLLERKNQLGGESESISKLVDSLDVQKEEAILRTFRGVSKHFSEVFSELVKNGQGRLVMRTSDDMNDIDGGEELELHNENDTSENDANDGSLTLHLKKGTKIPQVATFQGVQVHVSFGGSGQQYEMRQLSGGQKALVALALIFAIQRSDPAPFYLFDEIDQALDANYRLEVARLIERQATDKGNPAQFITTTFRPEMVSVAHRHYGIELVDKTSSIHYTSKKDAENFVLDLMNEEEALGDVTSVATYDASVKGKPDNVETVHDDNNDIDDEEGLEKAKVREFAEESGVQLEGESSGESSDEEQDPFDLREMNKKSLKRVR